MLNSEILNALKQELVEVSIHDRVRFERRLASLQRLAHRGERVDQKLEGLQSELAAAKTRLARRRSSLPKPEYPAELPVVLRRDEIARAIAEHQVVIVCGDTGSGKTTQLPKICLEMGRGVAGLIGHTQPRRIAARTVAFRIAEELKTQVGHGVGFKVRFSDHVSPETYLKLMTDGILLAEIQRDRFLTHYDTLIIDEAHERSLNIDFLLGYLKRLMPKRPDLKVIITSATIDPERFSKHFNQAPILKVEGRTFPVEARYRPLVSLEGQTEDRTLCEGIVDACVELSSEGAGDILVFLPGEREIREAAEELRKHHPAHTQILPLYARLSTAEQQRVFEPHRSRRIVLATNVAETSLTVPGIRYVVDSGNARISRYSWRAKLQRLPIEPISQSAADQRMGRCGRVGPGICIRLFSEEDWLARPRFTEPEIQRTNLAAVVLQMNALGLGEVNTFPFMDPPDPRLVKDGYRLLEELHAVDNRNHLTNLGHRMARLPVDPRLGRMLLEADREGSLNEVLVIVSALAVQDPRERPVEYQQAADSAHKRFLDDRSDFLSFLKLWTYFHEQGRHHSKTQLRKLCQREFLSWVRMREWIETWRQLRGQLTEMGFRENQVPADYGSVHRALLSGLLSHVGFKAEDSRDKHVYLGARNRKFYLFPGSNLHNRGPKWVMASEITETARTFARTVAKIQPEWVEKVGAHLLKHHVFEPHWEQRPARVVAYDKVTLYGLVIQARKRVDYARNHPEQARELFIRHALIYGEFHSRGGFLKHNMTLIEEVEALEAKARRPDILIDEHALFVFYDHLIPREIHDGNAFERWRAQAEQDNPRLLYLSRESLMQHGAERITSERFPEQITMSSGVVLPLVYHFEPGSEMDGVTLRIPLAATNQVDRERCEWLVPGLLEEKIAAMIRMLPKGVRKHFVPAPDFARACTQALAFGRGDLVEEVAQQLKRMTGVEVPPEIWNTSSLPEHLRMRFEVLDTNGDPLATGRDLQMLSDRLEARVKAAIAAMPPQSVDRENITRWDFGDLPESIDVKQQGIAIKGFPALVRVENQVDLRVLDTAAHALEAHREGLLGLFRHSLREPVKYLFKHLPQAQTMCLHFVSIGDCDVLKNDLIDAVIQEIFLMDPLPRTEAEFTRRLDSGRGEVIAKASQLATEVAESLDLFYRIRQTLKGNIPLSWIEAVADIRVQLEYLIYPGFIRATPALYRQRLPRYLKAIERRLERLRLQPEKDRRLRLEVQPLWERCRLRWGQGQPVSQALEEYRWQIEELRVSLFAQELGTPKPVSVSRLERYWKQVGDV